MTAKLLPSSPANTFSLSQRDSKKTVLQSLKENKGWKSQKKDWGREFTKETNGSQVCIQFDNWAYRQFFHRNFFPALFVLTLGLGPLLLSFFYQGVDVSFSTTTHSNDRLKSLPVSFLERWHLRRWFKADKRRRRNDSKASLKKNKELMLRQLEDTL